MMPARPDQGEYAGQQKLIAALQDVRCFPHAAKSVRLIETHISWVLLAGRYAYKIKKALNLGFLDFTSLEARRFYCEEEIRLNRRLAPKIYLDVMPIGGSPLNPQFGAQPVLEYAVRMRRFAVSKQLDFLLARGRVTPAHMDKLAATLAAFHDGLPGAAPDSAFGTPQAVRAAAQQNFEQLSSLLATPEDLDALVALGSATEKSWAECEQDFAQRHAQGCVRECHGDLHLGNIALIGDEPVPFDGIEFNPALRWIDVMDEVAFLMMDLLHKRRPDLAYCFLNAWLEASGDYAGVSVLRFYLAYRAVVRAKVDAIRAAQAGGAHKRMLAASREYLALAGECLAGLHPLLIITHGLPGSGKSTFAKAAAERLQAIRLRSDVERKRLFGLHPLDDSRSAAGAGIYTAQATQRTYARLHELARGLLEAGFPVIVDAAFLRQDERDQFHALARELTVPFAIASMQASADILRARIVRRRGAASDASEADLDVLQALQVAQQPLVMDEYPYAVQFGNDEEDDGFAAHAAAWRELDMLCRRPR